MRRAAHSGPAQAETMKIEIQKKIAQVGADMNTSLNPLRKQESYKAWDLCAFISKKSFMSQCFFFLCVPYVKWMTTRHGTHLFDVSVQYTPQPFLLFFFFKLIEPSLSCGTVSQSMNFYKMHGSSEQFTFPLWAFVHVYACKCVLWSAFMRCLWKDTLRERYGEWEQTLPLPIYC